MTVVILFAIYLLGPAFGDIYIESFEYPDGLDITDQTAVFAYFGLHKREDRTEAMYKAAADN